MSITVVTPASDQWLTSMIAVQSELNTSGGDDDVRFTQLINEASDFISRYCGKTFGEERIKEKIGAHGLPEILLDRTPITTVHTITFNGSLVAADEYEISNREAGILWREAGWTTTEMDWGGIAAAKSPYLNPLWLFEYTGGYKLPSWGDDPINEDRTLPYDLERACLDIISSLHNGAKIDPNIKRYKVGETDVSWDREGGILTQRITSVLDFHRRAF